MAGHTSVERLDLVVLAVIIGRKPNFPQYPDADIARSAQAVVRPPNGLYTGGQSLVYNIWWLYGVRPNQPLKQRIKLAPEATQSILATVLFP